MNKRSTLSLSKNTLFLIAFILAIQLLLVHTLIAYSAPSNFGFSNATMIPSVKKNGAVVANLDTKEVNELFYATGLSAGVDPLLLKAIIAQENTSFRYLGNSQFYLGAKGKDDGPTVVSWGPTQIHVSTLSTVRNICKCANTDEQIKEMLQTDHAFAMYAGTQVLIEKKRIMLAGGSLKPTTKNVLMRYNGTGSKAQIYADTVFERYSSAQMFSPRTGIDINDLHSTIPGTAMTYAEFRKTYDMLAFGKAIAVDNSSTTITDAPINAETGLTATPEELKTIFSTYSDTSKYGVSPIENHKEKVGFKEKKGNTFIGALSLSLVSGAWWVTDWLIVGSQILGVIAIVYVGLLWACFALDYIGIGGSKTWLEWLTWGGLHPSDLNIKKKLILTSITGLLVAILLILGYFPIILIKIVEFILMLIDFFREPY